MPFLDGKPVPDSEIIAGRHKFIGTFRYPQCPYPGPGVGVLLCPCGAHLKYRESVYEHWLQGHMDIPMYETIDNFKDLPHGVIDA